MPASILGPRIGDKVSLLSGSQLIGGREAGFGLKGAPGGLGRSTQRCPPERGQSGCTAAVSTLLLMGL